MFKYIIFQDVDWMLLTLVGFPPWRHGSGHVGFVVDKAALEVFSEYFCFPCQSFNRFIHTHIIGGWYCRPVVASVIVDWVPLPPPKKKTFGLARSTLKL
jgi:hypothetical protein